MNKVALVTGASRGIGRGIALQLGREGWDVCVNYIEQKEAAEAVAAELRAMGRRAVVCQADVADSSFDPEGSYLTDERKRLLHKALSELPREMQAAIHLVYFEELSYMEAAKVMKRSVKQVDNLLYRSKAMLRSILGKEGADIL